jgi:RecA-family ATPase
VTQPEKEVRFGRLASEIPEQKIDWIARHRIARGKIQEVTGDPAVNKTTYCIDLAAKITTGGSLPDGQVLSAGPIIYLSAEDDDADTLVPRFRVAGAKMNIARILPAQVMVSAGEMPLYFPEQIKRIEKEIVLDGAVAFFIDPFAAFLGEQTDSHNDASVRRALLPLRALAERTRCAIVMIRHLNKMSGVDRALYRAGGSIAFTAAVRLSYLLALDPTDKSPEAERRRILACVKSNIGPKPSSLAFRVRAEDDEPPHIEWIDGSSSLTADDLLRVHHERKAEAMDEAVAFLEDELKLGARPTEEVEQHARDLRISDRTLIRARKKLDVRAFKKGFGGDWFLSFPATPDEFTPEERE